jgi:hypothetical protein
MTESPGLVNSGVNLTYWAEVRAGHMKHAPIIIFLIAFII